MGGEKGGKEMMEEILSGKIGYDVCGLVHPTRCAIDPIWRITSQLWKEQH